MDGKGSRAVNLVKARACLKDEACGAHGKALMIILGKGFAIFPARKRKRAPNKLGIEGEHILGRVATGNSGHMPSITPINTHPNCVRNISNSVVNSRPELLQLLASAVHICRLALKSCSSCARATFDLAFTLNQHWKILRHFVTLHDLVHRRE